MDFDSFQEAAKETERGCLEPGQLQIASTLGLCSEAGSLAAISKKRLRDGSTAVDNEATVRRELGDALWYCASIANAHDLRLDDIASENLERAKHLYGSHANVQDACQKLRYLDEDACPDQQFPRNFEVEFTPTTRNSRTASSMKWRLTQGQEEVKAEECWKELGDVVSDNAHEDDGYRYHDALHLAFVAILGWSPSIRALMGRKRKCDKHVDDNEDGGRGVVIDEGVIAWLYSRDLDCSFSESPTHVDTETLSVVSKMVQPVEVSQMPMWAWRHAIHEGFKVWASLEENHGHGRVRCSLESRCIDFSKTQQHLEKE